MRKSFNFSYTTSIDKVAIFYEFVTCKIYTYLKFLGKGNPPGMSTVQ